MSKETLFYIITALDILITGLFVVIALYVISILKDIKNLSQKAKKEGNEILEDVKTLRENVKQEGENLKNFGKFLLKIFNRKK